MQKNIRISKHENKYYKNMQKYDIENEEFENLEHSMI